ncbi:MAG: peptidoglycan-binding protein LysM [Candidatus Aminicenantes bacterium]|nr:peptidoglycan-binding protein LysM [Candidatus Aminicenantes bacterium]
MGIFDFIKDAGASIFGEGRDEAKEITNLLSSTFGDQISDLKVEFKDDIVTLYGSCDTQATKEKAVLIAGNVKGVAGVNDVYFSAPPAEEEVEYYVVQPGDSLSKIAKTYYGNAMKYPEIFEANKEVIKDPDLIYPGQKLRIPKIG